MESPAGRTTCMSPFADLVRALLHEGSVRLRQPRRWPLSGVLADIDEPPLLPVDLGGHPGLLLLYAERLARQRRPAWVADGPAREYIELVFGERNLPLGG